MFACCKRIAQAHKRERPRTGGRQGASPGVAVLWRSTIPYMHLTRHRALSLHISRSSVPTLISESMTSTPPTMSTNEKPSDEHLDRLELSSARDALYEKVTSCLYAMHPLIFH